MQNPREPDHKAAPVVDEITSSGVLGVAKMASDEKPIVVVVDDDSEVRESLGSLLRSVGLDAMLLASGTDLLKYGRPDRPTCLVLDVRLPGESGLGFQRQLAASNIHVPIIFITGYGDISMSIQAMKGGAIEFLTKPFRDQDLLDAIQLGLAQDRASREEERTLGMLRERFATLTPRERQIMARIARGHRNKHIADDIGISKIMVQAHRSQVMRKMRASSLPDLARMADKLKL